MALTGEPALSDHQHLDSGHFEVVRGADALILDAGGYGSYSSLSHNVIAVDDHRENDNYAPNQGTWGGSSGIVRFEDAGRFGYALADCTSSYNPAGYPADHPQRSVSRAEREAVFSRSKLPSQDAWGARIVIYDRITLTKPTFGATFLLHGGGQPEVHANTVRWRVGRSAAVLTTLIPEAAAPLLVREPTDLGDGPYYANDPPEGVRSVRVEISSPRGDGERRFLHSIVVSGDDVRAPAPVRVEGRDIDGVALEDEVYAFVRSGPQTKPASLAYSAPASAVHHVIASLAPGARYAVHAENAGDTCRLALEPAPEGKAASKEGVVVVEMGAPCEVR
jgi:hypothetical protein